ncbi:MAG: lipase maturation factor family protein [Pseudomonadales bacterium]
MSEPGPSATQHLLVYDRDCAFCCYMVGYARAITGDRVEYRGYQDVAHEHPDISEASFRESIHLFSGSSVTRGAEAAARTLAFGGHGALLACYRHVPGFASGAEHAYRLVARHRRAGARLARWLFGPALRPAAHQHVARVFTACIGLCALIAFASFWWQAQGLVGNDGILPYRPYLDGAQAQLGAAAYVWIPTLAWLGSSDLVLHLLCGAGVAASLLLTLGRVRASAALTAYLTYLSLVAVGQTFMAYQWDSLLLECLVVAAVAARAPTWGIWTARLLLLRFMLLSGAVKLLSGDPDWATGAALEFHFETQPLPTLLAWYAHQLPRAILHSGAWATLFIELVLPLCILLPLRARLLAAAGFVLLELLILLTGNYNFFNLLTIALCTTLLNDSKPRAPGSRPRRLPARLCAATLMALGSLVTAAGLLRQPLPAALAPLQPLHLVNQYGLFAVMTRERRELVVEGSLNGSDWRRYRFPFKPGALQQAPRLAAPYQPRLDWQMWFAALGKPQDAPWIYDFVQTLLEGRAPVLRLVEAPFEGQAPKYVRILSLRYRFTSAEERQRSGNWWHADDPRIWLEPMRLRRPVIRHEPLTLE